MADKLTDKQKRFCDEYLIDLNATQAYLRAGYSARNENIAGVEGFKLLKNPKIDAYIKRRMKDREKRTEITQDKVLNELAKIGFSDIKNFLRFGMKDVTVGVDEEGNPITQPKQVVEVKESEEVDGTLINEVSISAKGVFTFKLHDKMTALDKIGKHLGMFTDKVEMTGKDGGPIEIKTMKDEEIDQQIQEMQEKLGLTCIK